MSLNVYTIEELKTVQFSILNKKNFSSIDLYYLCMMFKMYSAEDLTEFSWIKEYQKIYLKIVTNWPD